MSRTPRWFPGCAFLMVGWLSLAAAGCGPGALVILAAAAASSSGGGGGGPGRSGQTCLESATFVDVNENGRVDGVDTLTLFFSDDVSVLGLEVAE